MTPLNRLRLVALMVLSGGYAVIIGAQIGYGFGTRDSLDIDALRHAANLLVVFWLAAESYGLRLQLDKLRVRNARLADALEERDQRIENERP